MDKTLRIGYHISIAQSLDLAYDRAAAAGCTAMQIFVTNPRAWDVRNLDSSEASEFIRKSRTFDVKPVCVHMPYLPNLASSNTDTYGKSILSLRKNIEMCKVLGIKYLITHMGSHLGKGKEAGLRNIINSLESIADGIGEVMVLLENQAGHANSIGAKIEDLVDIYDRSSLAEKGRLGFCLDTCHLFAAGYDIADENTLDNIDSVLDFDNVHAFHINDAAFPLGSGKDRHANIGLGHIGLEGFGPLINYDGVWRRPLILETPLNPDFEEGHELNLIRDLLSE